MVTTVQIPIDEYQTMKRELIILKKQDLLIQVNELLELMFQNKYGLYLGDFTDDLVEQELNELKEWNLAGDVWNFS
jgi:hypothetical protein